MRPLFHALTDSIGRRGAVLALFGVVWVLFGYSLITVPPQQVLNAQLLDVPLRDWAFLWLACGVVAILFAPTKQGRDGFGYAAIVLPTWVWTLGYLVMWIGHNGFDPRAWVSVFVWGAVSLVTLVCAGWPEVTQVPKVPKEPTP